MPKSDKLFKLPDPAQERLNILIPIINAIKVKGVKDDATKEKKIDDVKYSTLQCLIYYYDFLRRPENEESKQKFLQYCPEGAAFLEQDLQTLAQDVRFLLEYYKEHGKLQKRLTYQNVEDTDENILHVAMMFPEIFKIIIDIANNNKLDGSEKSILQDLLFRPDVNGDYVVHQLVEFGRVGSLQILCDLAGEDKSIRETLQHSMNLTNQWGLTPRQVAASIIDESSQIVKDLQARDKVTPAQKEAELEFAKTQSKEIVNLFDQLELEFQKYPRAGM
jgi:hypothetical protein